MAEIFDFGFQKYRLKLSGVYNQGGLFAVVGDTARRIEVQLLDAAGRVTDTTGIELSLSTVVGQSASYVDANLIDASKGLYQVDLTNGLFLKPGKQDFQWKIYKDGKQINSVISRWHIDKSVSEGGNQSFNFYLNVDDLKRKTEELEAKQDEIKGMQADMEAENAAMISETESMQQELRDIQQDFVDDTVESEALRISVEQSLEERYSTLEADYSQDLSGLKQNDTELTAQLAQTDHKLTLEGWELNSKGRRNGAFTVFRSDDGVREEYTHALPLFKAKGVPQNIAIVSDWVTDSRYVSKEELLELQNEHGWEILSHSKSHPVRSAGKTMIPDLPESDARYELKQSRDDLRNMGLDVESYAVVGGEYNTRDRQLFREYYRSALITSGGRGGRRRGLNQSPITSHDMYTHWIDPTAGNLMNFLKTETKEVAIQKTLQEAYEVIDYASENGGIIIFGTHFTYIAEDADYMQMYSDLIDYAKSKTKVTTLSDALNNYGNIVEIGDNASLFSNQSPERRSYTNHLAIGIDGKMSGGNLTELNEYTGLTDWKDFPLGITTTPVSTAAAIESGLPEGEPGVLTNYKLVPTPIQYSSFNYQIYRVSRSKREYVRHIDNDLNLSSWILNSTGMVLDGEADNSLRDGIESYALGITYSPILSNHPDINLTPDGKPGLLITTKTSNGVRIGFNTQIYITNFELNPRMYFRRATSETEWSVWKDLFSSNVYSTEKNNYNIATPITEFDVGITYSRISEGSPSGEPGTLTTHRAVASGSVGLNYQEFHEFQTGDIYKRTPTGDNTWGSFRKLLME